jgi:hypothetical protein
MKKQLLLWLTKNVALSHSFKRLAFLAIALTLSFTASAQTHCDFPITSSTYTVLVSYEQPTTNNYVITVKSSIAMTGVHAGWYIGASGGNFQAVNFSVFSNSNKTLKVSFTSTTKPNLYTNIHILYPGLIQFVNPSNASITWGTCTVLPSPTFGTFTVGSKLVGDTDFTITPPSSNSTGAFTYSSSNTNVATIVNGNQIRVVGFTGTSTITANQAATASYSAGNTSATLTVTSPNPTPTLGTFTVGPKLSNDVNFTITPPTTNSSGTFSYTSSNSAVATIVNGNQIDVLTAGTTTITAIQSYDGSYTAGSTTATLTVTDPIPGVSPTPPLRNSLNAFSVFSDTAYPIVAGTRNYNPGWGQAGSASVISIEGNDVWRAINLNYQGIVLGSFANLSAMTHFHVDVWTINETSIQFFLIDNSTGERSVSLATYSPLIQGSWISYDIPLTAWTSQSGFTTAALKEFKIVGSGGKTVYMDNMYFYKQDTWSGTTTTNWATATNWASGSAPTSTSDVVIASSANQPIIGSDVTINSLAISTGATLTVNSGYNLTVTNAVANSGTMTLQNNANLLQSSATTTNSNSGNLIVKRNSASLLRLDHTLWSSPVASQNLYNFSPLTLMNRFYTYNTVSNGYVTTGLDATTTFAAGKGYAVRAPNDHSALTPTTWEGTFTGIPNNGTVPFTLDTNGSGFNLVGNPYPSPITATSFLTENSSKIGGTLYFYAHSLPMNADGTFPTGTNYSTWNASATTVATTATSPDPHLAPEVPNGIIQVGQGFFVKATAAGTINFTNTMRVANNANQFFRTTEIERHRLWLNLTTESGDDINQIAVAYVEGATQNADTNFDGLSFGNAGSMLSSKIDGSDYVIQGRSLPFASNDMVPLGFKATAAGNYKIVLTDKDGLFLGNQDVFVRDNLMGIEHNIKVSPYTFASEIGTFDTRIQLVYNQTLGIPSTTFTPNAVIVYKNTDGFHVTTNGIVMKDILVYDISGRLIFKQTNINGTATVLKGLLQTKQVLLLKITSQENETVTVKAIN